MTFSSLKPTNITLRRLCQLLSLFVFLYLLLKTASSGDNLLGPQVNWFLRLDPLLWLSDLLARGLPFAMLWTSLLLVIASLFLGRFFCGWVCPMGTLLDVFARLTFRDKRPVNRERFRNVKYYLLLLLLIPLPLSAHLMGLVDPLCLLTRSLAIVVYPATTFLSDQLGGLYQTPLAPLSEPLYQFLRDHYIPPGEPTWHFPLFWPTLLVFAAVFALEAYGRRFWCRYLCPLGALFSALSVFAFLRRRPARSCKDCGECQGLCKASAFGPDFKLHPNECLECLRCEVECPKERVGFSFRTPDPKKTLPDLSRRAVLSSLAVGAAAVPLLETPAAKVRSDTLLRPPGVTSEEDFLTQCARCGACIKVCPTQGLTAVLLEAGPAGLFTPKLNPSVGWCEFKCTLCGQACPTGAIPALTELGKANARMGTSSFNRDVCIPYARFENCLVCEEVCPTPQKAIVFVARRVSTPKGEREVLFPRVERSRCVGCGICEHKCPLEGKKGITTWRSDRVRPELPPPEGEVIDVAEARAALSANPYGTSDPYGGGE